MNSKSEWWRVAAQHMWRTYYFIKRSQALPDAQRPSASDADMRIYDMCDSIVNNMFDKRDQDILQMYFSSSWGNDLHDVEAYSKSHNIPVNVIWIVIRRANRAVIEHLGILDKKIIIGITGNDDDNT